MSYERSIPSTVTMEEYVRRSLNYTTRLVDSDYLPYFNVFWTNPPQAAHDWPDPFDVTGRQYQALVMARIMTGERLELEDIWRRKLLDRVNLQTGRLIPSEGEWFVNEHGVNPEEFGGMCLILYAFITAYMDEPDEEIKLRILRIVDLLDESFSNPPAGMNLFAEGFIKPLMLIARYLGSEKALRLAREGVNRAFFTHPVFTPDNTYTEWGHMHGNLHTLMGAADYAIYTGDAEIFSRVYATYLYVKSTGTRFGFIPEVIGRKGDIISCETCALMDMLATGTTLANHGHPELWEDIERLVRNQLIESQIKDASWLKSDNTMDDTDRFTWKDIGERIVGAYAGWTSPTHILAAKEYLPWGDPEHKTKVRILQNCCGGSGTHAFFIAWRNAARFENGVLSVHMHFDKLLPQAEIRCMQPYLGKTVIRIREVCQLRVRVPETALWTAFTVNGVPFAARRSGNYALLNDLKQGDEVVMTYPLPLITETVRVGNPGHQQYTYDVTWKGATVVSIKPAGEMPRVGYSDFSDQYTEIYYGEDGPGRLYLRGHVLSDIEPLPSSIGEDTGKLDLWMLRERMKPDAGILK